MLARGNRVKANTRVHRGCCDEPFVRRPSGISLVVMMFIRALPASLVRTDVGDQARADKIRVPWITGMAAPEPCLRGNAVFGQTDCTIGSAETL